MSVIRVQGKTEYVRDDEDIIELVSDYCGNDLADILKDRLSDNISNLSDKDIEKILQQTDFYSYEASLDAWNAVGSDILDGCNSAMSYMASAKRLSKDKIYNYFKEIKKHITGAGLI